MDPNIHRTIKSEYDTRQRIADARLDERKADLYRRIPRLEEIAEEIQQAGLKCGRLIVAGILSPPDAEKTLSDTIANLTRERADLLAKHGYTQDYLNPVYTCQKCFDTGIVRSSREFADTVCSCYRQQMINHIYDQSNLPIHDITGFVSFETRFYATAANEEKYGIKNSPRKQIQGILEHCKDFVNKFSHSDKKNMLFYGPAGVGKTHMSACIAMELMSRGNTVLYQTAPVLFNTIYEYRYKSSNETGFGDSTYRNILEVDLLILDDLGTESPTAMRYAELLSIIDIRNTTDGKRPCKTIIATNVHPKALFEYYDERVVSRITGGYDMFWFAGDDIRRLKAAK